MNDRDKGIISRNPGPMGIILNDTKRVFSEIWKKSPEIVRCLKLLREKKIEPEQVLGVFFESGTDDQVLWCFLVLVSLDHEETLVVINDLSDHLFDSVDEAYEWFCSKIYKKEKICSGRHDYGRKKTRTTT